MEWNLDLGIRVFFILGLFQCIDWRLIFGSELKKTRIVTLHYYYQQFRTLFDVFKELSEQILIREFICSGG